MSMSQNRAARFQRLLEYQTKRLDATRQSIAAQRASIQTCQQQFQQLETELHRSYDTPEVQINMAHLELAGPYQTRIQQKLNAMQQEINTANEELNRLYEVYQDQEQRKQSWEKMVEQADLIHQQEVMQVEQKQADELYLLTNLTGEQS